MFPPACDPRSPRGFFPVPGPEERGRRQPSHCPESPGRNGHPIADLPGSALFALGSSEGGYFPSVFSFSHIISPLLCTQLLPLLLCMTDASNTRQIRRCIF